MVRIQADRPHPASSLGGNTRENGTNAFTARRSPPSEAYITFLRSHLADRVQFHWQDYKDKGYLDALCILNDFRREGHISAIGLCNFDTIHTDEICTQLGPGVVVSNQVQVCLYHLFSCEPTTQRRYCSSPSLTLGHFMACPTCASVTDSSYSRMGLW
jgi:Aldo/keto reductase family